MKVTFLGTAAAEGVPALWCECDGCRQARRRRGKDLRRRAAYLVDGDTMIDFGPDVFWQTATAGIDSTELRRVLVTHTHGDHLSPLEFLWRRSPWYSCVTRQLTVIGSRRVFARILSFAAEDSGVYALADLNIRPREIAPGQRLVDGDLAVTALAAEHAPGKEAQLFVVERGGRRFFLAGDTGFLPESGWAALRGLRLDLVAIDTTYGLGEPDHRENHMGAAAVAAFRDRLLAEGCIDPGTPVYATHFSHNWRCDQASLENYFLPRGIGVAYDGMTVELPEAASAAVGGLEPVLTAGDWA